MRLQTLVFYSFGFVPFSRLAAHNTAEHEIHVDKRWRGVNVLRGHRGPADTHIMDQRLCPTELQGLQPQVTGRLYGEMRYGLRRSKNLRK